MASFVKIDNLSKSGSMSISTRVFDQLVTLALMRDKDIAMSAKQLKKNQKIRINHPVQTKITHGIVHVWLAINVKKGVSLQEATNHVVEEVNRVLLMHTETIPFDVQVKVEEII